LKHPLLLGLGVRFMVSCHAFHFARISGCVDCDSCAWHVWLRTGDIAKSANSKENESLHESSSVNGLQVIVACGATRQGIADIFQLALHGNSP
jgi:hypothetical protein